ncbi:MAG: protease complex subunit PrcB family protein [Candidatus Methylumidiphilus sp.]
MRLFLFAWLLANALAVAAGAALGRESPASFLVIEQGTHSGIKTQRLDAIRDDAALRALWLAHRGGLSPAPPLPKVDFSKDMLIVAFAGQKSTGGYRLNVVGLGARRGRIQVDLSLTQPGPDCLVAQTATQPFVMFKISRSRKPVAFQLTAKTFSCVYG